MSRIITQLKLNFANIVVFHTIGLEGWCKVIGARSQEEGWRLDNTLPAVHTSTLEVSQTRDKKTASESEAMSHTPSLLRKFFFALKKLLQTQWVVA